jgi:hypothetical protein
LSPADWTVQSGTGKFTVATKQVAAAISFALSSFLKIR